MTEPAWGRDEWDTGTEIRDDFVAYGATLMRCCHRWEPDRARVDEDSLIPYEGMTHRGGLCPRGAERQN